MNEESPSSPAVNTASHKYYETYWSEEGYNPQTSIHPKFKHLIQEVITSETFCADVGCGEGGSYAQWLNHSCKTYVGFDVSQNAISAARSRGLDARLVKEDGRLPLDSDTATLIICNEVLEHLYDPLDACREMLRILQPSGLAFFSTPNVAYWRRRLDLGLLGRWNPMGDDKAEQEPWRDPHIRFFTRNAMTRLIQTAGFELLHTGGHDGAFSRDIPILRDIIPSNSTDGPYSVLENHFPSLFALRLHVVARKVSNS